MVTITVSARDAVGAIATGTVTATQGAANVPVLTPINFTVLTAPVLDTLIGTIAGTNNPTSYTIVSGDPSHNFAIYASQHLRTSETIGPPPDGIYHLMVSGSNANGVGAAVPINVTIGATPVVASANFSLILPVAADEAIGDIAHSMGTPTSWAIISGNTNGYFTISNTGKISVTSAGVAGLKAATYSLIIAASNALGTSNGMPVVIVLQPQGSLSPWAALDGSLAPGGVTPSSVVVPSNTGVGTQTANTILNKYHATGSDRRDMTIPLYQPPWKVAGVDYAVGPKTTPTKNPQTQTPAGCSVSGSTFTVGSDNVVVDGFDFTLGNSGSGYQIHVAANGVTITNSLIPVLAITGTYALQIDGNSPTLTYNDFNGGVGVSASIINMISWSSGTGTMTLEYNYFHSVPSSPINYGNTLASGNTPTTICKYNFYTNMATYSGAHMNLGQFGNGGFVSVTFDFNTFYQTPNTAGGEGFQVYLQDNTGTGPLGEIQGGSSSYNTLSCPVTGSGTVSNFYDIGPPGGNQQSTPIGGAGGAGALITGSITGTDLNITVIQGVARVGDLVFTRSGIVVSAATTILSQTSGTTGSTGHYAVSNSQTVTSQSLLLGAFTIANNYIDYTGSTSGGFMHDQNGAEIIPDTTNHYMPTGQWVDIANTLH